MDEEVGAGIEARRGPRGETGERVDAAARVGGSAGVVDDAKLELVARWIDARAPTDPRAKSEAGRPNTHTRSDDLHEGVLLAK